MSRSVPWRNKPTPLITQMIPVANEYKLYLVHQTGPTSFVFKDESDNKFKVTIGFTISCSCGVVQHDHCIHTLYVLLKRFKVPQNNPILWQASYLDSQLEGLVRLKYAQKKKQQTKKHSYRRTTPMIKSEQLEEDDFPPLQQDEMCPICYQEMNNQCYSTCKTCHKSMHTKCFKIWTKHKHDSGLPVSCPMCRSLFFNPTVIIFKDLQRWQARFSTHQGTLCRGCGVKPIKGSIFKCLMVSNYDLCKLCFDGYHHVQHQHFFTKNARNQAWQVAPLRVKKTKKHLFQPTKDIPVRSIQISNNQFVVDLFITLRQYSATQQSSSFAVIGNDILSRQVCMRCKTPGNDLMKRLSCGHAVHQQCFLSMLSNQQYHCEIDGQLLCPGYFQAMEIKVGKPKKKTVQLASSREEGQIEEKLSNLQINGTTSKTSSSVVGSNKRNYSMNKDKSKDKNFRIMKKTAFQKKTQETPLGGFGMMVVTGLGHINQGPIAQTLNVGLPPRMKSHINPNLR